MQLWTAFCPCATLSVGPYNHLPAYVQSQKDSHSRRDYGIINTQPDGQQGSHWLLWTLDASLKHIYIYDPYGALSGYGEASRHTLEWLRDQCAGHTVERVHVDQQPATDTWLRIPYHLLGPMPDGRPGMGYHTNPRPQGKYPDHAKTMADARKQGPP